MVPRRLIMSSTVSLSIADRAEVLIFVLIAISQLKDVSVYEIHS